MRDAGDSRPPATDPDSGEGLDEDPGDDLEAMIVQADRAFASDSFGTTAEEQEEGEPLDQRLAGERPGRRTLDSALEMEDDDGADEEAELVGEGNTEHDPFVAPEEAAMSIREEAPGATDHPDEHGDVDSVDK